MLAPSTTSGDLPINLITSEWGQEISIFTAWNANMEMRAKWNRKPFVPWSMVRVHLEAEVSPAY